MRNYWRHHTRLLVYRERMDNIVGIVHVRKVKSCRMENNGTSAEKVMRKPYLFGGPVIFPIAVISGESERAGLRLMNMANGWAWYWKIFRGNH